VTRTDAEDRPYLHHLIEDVRKPYYRLAATDTPFAAKDRLKARRYRWDADARCWYTDESQDTVTAELAWLTQLTGDFPRGHAMVARLPLRGRFDEDFKAQYESPEYVFDEAARA
jgi:DNA polymerase-3 subunit epsilon